MDLPQTEPGTPAPSIDPLREELAEITCLEHVFKWLGSSPTLQQGLVAALGGGTPKLRDIVFVKGVEWDAAIAAVRVTPPPVSQTDDSEQPTPTPRTPTPIELGHLAMVRRIARLRLGLTAKEQIASVATPDAQPSGITATQPAPPGSAEGASASEPVVKLSTVLDPTIDAPLVRLKLQLVRRMFSDYKDTFGAEPAEDAAPTEEQVSAVQQLPGCDRFLYACLSIYGPYGKRMLVKIVYLAYFFMPDGSWQKRELPGPPSYEHWWQVFRVFRITLLLLKAVPPELLDNYIDMVKRFANTYGPRAWFLVYQAEVRMRSEHFERLRRIAERTHDAATTAGGKSEYDPAKPWATVFAMAVGAETKTWWEDNLHRDAVLFLANVRSAAAITDDGTVQPALDAPASVRPADVPNQGDGAATVKPPPKKRPPKAQPARPPPQQPPRREERITGDVYARSGKMLCNFYNKGNCNYAGTECYSLHSGKQCRQFGHPQINCPKLGGNGADVQPQGSSADRPQKRRKR